MVEVICPHNLPLKSQKGETIDIDFSLSMGLWGVEGPVVWHAKKKS